MNMIWLKYVLVSQKWITNNYWCVIYECCVGGWWILRIIDRLCHVYGDSYVGTSSMWCWVKHCKDGKRGIANLSCSIWPRTVTIEWNEQKIDVLITEDQSVMVTVQFGNRYCRNLEQLSTEFWIRNWIYWPLFVITHNYSTIAYHHTLQITRAHRLVFSVCYNVYWSFSGNSF
jgi:hypothetical protein